RSWALSSRALARSRAEALRKVDRHLTSGHPSDHVIGLERAGRIAALDLERGMLDPEAVLQLPRDLSDKRVRRRPSRHDEMTRQCRLCRAHGPDVQVVDAVNPGEASQIGAHLACV